MFNKIIKLIKKILRKKNNHNDFIDNSIDTNANIPVLNDAGIHISKIQPGDKLFNRYNNTTEVLDIEESGTSTVYKIQLINNKTIALPGNQNMIIKLEDELDEKIMSVSSLYDMFKKSYNTNVRIPATKYIKQMIDSEFESPISRVQNYMNDMDEYFIMRHPWIVGIVIRTLVSYVDEYIVLDLNDFDDLTIDEISKTLGKKYKTNNGYMFRDNDGNFLKLDFLFKKILISEDVDIRPLEIVNMYKLSPYTERTMFLFGLLGRNIRDVEEILISDNINPFHVISRIPVKHVLNKDILDLIKFFSYSLGCDVFVLYDKYIITNIVSIEYFCLNKHEHRNYVRIKNIIKTDYCTSSFKLETDNPHDGYMTDDFIIVHE